jgi:hypothetical protein
MRRIEWGFCLLIAAGCGSSGPEIIPIETAPVTGVATFDGKPLENYRVYFYAADNPAQEPATARIAADGTFSLSVREPDDGAIIGKNQVWFSYDPPVPEQVPGYETPYDLPKPSVELPEEYLNQQKSPLSVDVPEDGLADYKIELP